MSLEPALVQAKAFAHALVSQGCSSSMLVLVVSTIPMVRKETSLCQGT